MRMPIYKHLLIPFTHHNNLVTFEMGAVLDSEKRADNCRMPTIDDWDGSNQSIIIYCPPWSPAMRTPAFCCGPKVGEKVCCEWSTFVVNQIGMGSTETGLILLVASMFVVSFIVFLISCCIFQTIFVRKWKRTEHMERNKLNQRINGISNQFTLRKPPNYPAEAHSCPEEYVALNPSSLISDPPSGQV